MRGLIENVKLLACVAVVSAALVSAARAQDCGPDWEPPFVVDAELYPFAHHCIQLTDGIMHYVDEQESPQAIGTVLMVHGNPTWSFMYRDVIADLRAQGFRVIAVDLLGFGMSSKPDPATFAYSARSQAQALREFVTLLDLQDVTLVVHDWGGPIGFFVAGGDPDRFTSFVVLNTWAWSLHDEDRPFFHFLFDWVNYNIVNTKWLLETGHLPKGVGRGIASIHSRPGERLYTNIRNAYWGPFLNVKTELPLSRDAIEPTNRFYHYVARDPAFMAEVQAGMAALVSKPVAFVFTERDKWFGSLRCDADGNPVCPPPLHCETVDGTDLCLDENGERFYPALDRFASIWDADAIRIVDVHLGGGHFTAEYLARPVADAVLLLNAELDATQLRR